MNWTAEQYAAIAQDGRDMLISAAAGSGKTAVLAERIVRLVREGTDIDRFLVVTFTDAATAEMKRRIAKRLREAAEEESGAEAADRLRAQALNASRANISTLHAFCLYILRRNFPALGLDPAFRTADAALAAILKKAALEECAAQRYEAADAGFHALLGGFGGREEALFEAVEGMYSFLLAQPEPWAWLEQAEADYALDANGLRGHPSLQALLAQCKQSAESIIAMLLRARALVPPGKEQVAALLDDDLAQVRSLQLAGDLENMLARLGAIAHGRFSWQGKDLPDVKELVKKRRDAAKTRLRALQQALPRPLAEEAAAMQALAPQVQALAAFLRDFHAIYAQSKAERALVDFHDMEHFALRALADAPVREGLRRRFQYIFVDEYQDSSRIQEHLLSSICRAGGLFLVGDVKQSIYRFRQADPGLFLEKLHSFAGQGDATGGCCIQLNCNFRSASPVVDAVNAVFSRIMHEEIGGLTYDENAALVRPPDARPPEEHAPDGCELHIIEKKYAEAGGDEGETAREELGDAEAEAMLAARRIQELRGAYRLRDSRTGEMRALRYSDFVVLLRAHRPVAQAWAQTLAAAGIPAYVQLAGGYFDAIEVQVFLNLLKVIDNARQDIPLLSVLRSPIFHFTMEELVELRTSYEGETLYARLLACAQGVESGELRVESDGLDARAQDAFVGSGIPDAPGDSGLPARAREVFAQLAQWRAERLLLPLTEFLAMLLESSGYYDFMGALRAGGERQANLDALLAHAQAYCGMGGGSDLAGFLAFMEGAASTAMLGGAQAGAADVVRVLTMHAAKGLEYPVVLLAGLGRRFSFLRTAQQAPLQYARELGLGVRLTLHGVRRDTLLRHAILAQEQRQQLAEEMRILYVGMTRAQNRLVMIGCMDDARGQMENMACPIAAAEAASVQSPLEWLLSVSAELPQVLPRFLYPRESIHAPAPQESAAAPAVAEEDLYEQVCAQLAWRYPYAEATQIPTKRSVSELVEETTRILEEAPAFARHEKSVTGSERGEATHTVLREIRLTLCPDGGEAAYVRQEVGRLREEALLNAPQAEALPQEALIWYLQSPMGRRMRAAERLERELDFSLEVPAGELFDSAATEPVLLQGVIDCCFVENGAWVLLDFKTDSAKGKTAEEAAAQHAPQVRVYADALARLTGMRVAEASVVLLEHRQVVQVEIHSN